MRYGKYQERFKRRLETEFSAENKKYRGISGDISLNGLFIRTNHAFTPGIILDIAIHLPHGITSRLKGRVVRALKTPIVSLNNGMGIQLIEKDSHYIDFMKSFLPDLEEVTDSGEIKPESEAYKRADKIHQPPSSDDFLVVKCSRCGVKNKVYKSKMSLGPKCGKCGSPLIILT